MAPHAELARRGASGAVETGRGSFVPAFCRVLDRRVEAADVVTLLLEPPREGFSFLPGQFNMLSALGVGEVAISISGAPEEPGPIRHTIRDVGAVTHALARSEPGSLVGLRGPFGTSWEIEARRSADVLVVAGGIGLAPLRGAITSCAAALGGVGRGRLFVAVGARLPEQVIFAEDLEAWRARGATVELTVDAAPRGYRGRVGLVTAVLPEMDFDPATLTALVCGPEIMMRFVARDLLERGVDPNRIAVSLERNMQCGIGLCGHCQLGPALLCRDGPVVSWAAALELLSERDR